MPRNPSAPWFPRLVGAALALLAFATWSFEPNDRFILPGFAVSGPLGAPGGAAPGAKGRNLDHLCLRIEPFDERALRARFAAHGVTLSEVHDNYGAEGRGPSVYLSDPEGNLVELKGPSRG